MSHQGQAESVSLNSRHLSQALQWLLAEDHLVPARLYLDTLLVRAALLWAWSDEQTLKERFFAARRLIARLFPEHGPLAGSSQAFIKLLRRWTASLICLLTAVLRERIRKALPRQWECSGFVVFEVDGSRVELPRTASHEAIYFLSPKRSGKKKRNCRKQPQSAAGTKKANMPQMWLTTMFHVETGPCDSSEREHALDMLGNLPEEGLLAADPGFVGYDFPGQSS